ncbi:MAG: GNAT family N-acetyltransferase [Candidatus Rokubacteria bacterium]|nr:GNAT family N-acetyltransferase [Candidatus Rokubacteria bacterium]
MGRYESSEKDDAPEVAFVVQDGWQAQGLGAVLLHDLMRAGEARGIHRFRAYVLADNARMLGLLARFTRVLEKRTEGNAVELLFAPGDG